MAQVCQKRKVFSWNKALTGHTRSRQWLWNTILTHSGHHSASNLFSAGSQIFTGSQIFEMLKSYHIC